LLLLAAVHASGVGDGLDRWVTDQHWRWRAQVMPAPFPPRVLVVAIDDRTLQSYGRLRYWSRERYARLLSKLRQADAVGFDILFEEADRDPRGDAAFARAVQSHGRVVLPFHRWTETRTYSPDADRELQRLMERFPLVDRSAVSILPTTYPQVLQPPLPALLTAAAALGSVDVTADPDGIYRAPDVLRRTPDGRMLPNFTLALACVAEKTPLAEAVAPVPSALRIAGRDVPLDDGYLLLQPMCRRSGSFVKAAGTPVPAVSFVDVLERMRPEEFIGKIVLVGETATGTTDIRPTPLDRGLRGMEFNAEILANLLTGAAATPAPAVVMGSLVLVALLAPLGLYSVLAPNRAVIGTAATGLGLIAVLEALFWSARMVPTWSPVLFGLLGSTLAMALPLLAQEEGRRRQLRETFSLYVAPEVVDEIVRDPGMQIQQAERRTVSVLFSDIRDFTPFAEQNPPEQVARQMTEYQSDMCDSVFEAHGVLDKFIGDAVMALFGPYAEENANLSAKAVVCALDMCERLDALNQRWAADDWPRFRIGIGIHTGEAVVGNFRAGKRSQFTALGDTVNLAARLQSATKELRATVIVSEPVKEEAEPLLGKYMTFLDRGVLTVKGREQPVRIYEVRPREEVRARNTQ
jgi:adenylate cyclase